MLFRSSSQVLLSGGTGSPTWASQSSLSVGSASTATTATTATNIAAGAAGSLPYQSGSGATSFVALGTAGYFLTAGASAPQWTQILPIANGGTNSTATPTAGGVGYGTGTAHAYTTAGTTGQALTSNGASAPSFGTLGVVGGGTGITTTTAYGLIAEIGRAHV